MSRCMRGPRWADQVNVHASMAQVALAIVRPGTLARTVTDAASGDRILVAGFDALDAALLRELRPSVIFAQAVSSGFDALDLARRLVALECPCRLVVFGGGLPDPDLVRTEIETVCPDLTIDVLSSRAPQIRRVHAV